MTTNQPARHPLDPQLTRLRRDLATIADDIRWAYTDAWWPTRPDPTAPTGRAPAIRPPDDNPDNVPGPKHAIGLGDDTTRAALAVTAHDLATIEFRTAAALATIGITRQPPVIRPNEHATLHQLERTIAGITTRLDQLREHGANLPPQHRAAPRHQLRRADTAADRAVRRLHTALNRGATEGIAHAEPLCRICNIRPQAMREHQIRTPNGSRTTTRPSKGGRCDTCSQYFVRNGNERPRELDTIDDALAAAARRRARGEGWGAA